MKFKKGDIVSRTLDGSDEQIVIEDEDGYGGVLLKCIKEPETKWIKLGETEYNLARRYFLIKERMAI